ncbi:hypothetical protein [Sorangium sp. So ce341]|uniref:hypothetical protein n=1 Tax=Sorangium sp. So ce341 TaxID=3133302 RepID=UPI003F5D7F07
MTTLLSDREQTFLDPRTGRAMGALRWPVGSETRPTVEGGHEVISGAVRNERFRIEAGAR